MMLKIKVCPLGLKNYYETIIGLMPNNSESSYDILNNVAEWIQYKGLLVRISLLNGSDYQTIVPEGHSFITAWYPMRDVPFIYKEFNYIITAIDILYSIDELEKIHA